MTDSALTPEAGCPSGLAPPASSLVGDLSAFVRKKDGLNQITLSVRGAKCGGCINKIESAVGALPGVETARMNLSNGKLSVGWRGHDDAQSIVACVDTLGYGVSAFSEAESSKAAQSEERGYLISMGVAAFALANIMLLSVSVWGGSGEMGEQTRRALHAISGFIAFPVLLFSGRHFFLSAWSVLKHSRTNMDVPISLALVLAFGMSVWATVSGGEHAYFDACMMLLFFLLIGRFLDARLRRQAHAAALDLAALQNRAVNRVLDSDRVEAVRADEVAKNDRILLAAGERTVIDLKVLSGQSGVDESMVTGESMPRTIGVGETLYAGTLNLDQPIVGQALGEASDSLLADIARMLEAGEQKRSQYRKIADKAVTLYVPFVHTTAALALAAWLLSGASIETSILVAVATLIITCPCALALAAPVTQVVAAGRLFKRGVFLRSGDALERFAQVDHVVLDKTGTLTLGTPLLVSKHGDELFQAAQLARSSRHPLSRAIVDVAGGGPLARDIKELPGLGVEGWIEDRRYRLGSAEWVGVDQTETSDGPTLWFAEIGSDPVHFRFADQLRPDAGEMVETLRTRGLSVEILSGDNREPVEKIAADLGIHHWQSNVSPQQKADRLTDLHQQGKKVLMVGDGLNDAGALALAHASLAPGGAMDVSQSAADGVFAGGLAAIPSILRMSHRTRQIMLQNFGLAALYNCIAVPIAVTGHVTPLIAAIAMSASSLIVTLNALRLNGTRS